MGNSEISRISGIYHNSSEFLSASNSPPSLSLNITVIVDNRQDNGKYVGACVRVRLWVCVCVCLWHVSISALLMSCYYFYSLFKLIFIFHGFLFGDDILRFIIIVAVAVAVIVLWKNYRMLSSVVVFASPSILIFTEKKNEENNNACACMCLHIKWRCDTHKLHLISD